MKASLASQDIWETVDRGFVDPQGETAQTTNQREALRDPKKKGEKALYIIYQGLYEATFEKVGTTTTSKQA